MVSKANDDLPLPDRPVITTSRSRGSVKSTFFRLCCRAPRISILSRGIPTLLLKAYKLSNKCSRACASLKYAGSSPMPAVFVFGSLVHGHIRPRHLVVLVVEDVAMQQVARAAGGVERKQVQAGMGTRDGRGLRRPADGEAVHEPGEHFGDVLPARFVGIGRDH